MGLLEWNLAAAILAGFGYLLVRNQRRSRRRRAQAADAGLEYIGQGLTHVPPELSKSVLFLVSDGGHEHDVMVGERVFDGEEVTLTQFDLAFQRDVRGEWAFVDTEPPFRLIGPTTVLAYQVPRTLPRLLVKRRGPSEIIADEPLELYKSGASVAREALGIDRTRAVTPPKPLGREPLALTPLDADYLIWGESEASARTVLGDDTVTLLQSAAASGRELVFETAGALVLVYCATDAALSSDSGTALTRLADNLCKTLLAQTAPP